ncbi:hypothetical protein NMY22_g8548 [Coprinellus aureogranulatus]|nr:hypothetical protein NMY22_g8548 [Coprinellus aureogranulatus]
MASRPPRKAVLERPSTKALLQEKKRRTPQEIEADKAVQQLEKRRKEDQKQAKHDAQKRGQARVGKVEDDLHREDLHREKTAARPDLHDELATADIGGPIKSSTSLKIKLKKTTAAMDSTQGTASENATSLEDVEMAEEGDDATRGSEHDASRSPPVQTEVDHEIHADRERRANPRRQRDNGYEGSRNWDGEQSTDESLLPSEYEGPETSVIDTDSDAPLAGFAAEESDDDREDDKDFKPDVGESSDDDDEDEDEGDESDEGKSAPRRKPSKPSTARIKKKSASEKKKEDALSFRQGVSSSRKTIAASAVSKAVANQLKRKSKNSDDEASDKGAYAAKKFAFPLVYACNPIHVLPIRSEVKRTKRTEPQGLLSGYKAKKAQTAPSSAASSDVDDSSELDGGFFDRDEDEDVLMTVRKQRGEASGRVSKKDDVKVTRDDDPSTRVYKKEDCRMPNLPYPGQFASRCRVKYKREYKSTVLAYVASLDEPFASGTYLGEELHIIWPEVFGSMAPLRPNDTRWFIVENVTNDFCLNYRSEIGKAGINIVVSMLRDCVDVITTAEGIEAAEFLLEDSRFLYGSYGAKNGQSWLPFQSDLIIKAFTKHMKQVVYCIKSYQGRRPVGAIALCAAAIERALVLVEDGTIDIEVWPPTHDYKGDGKRPKAHYTAFSEEAWGSAVARYVDLASKIPRDQWEDIASLATTDAIEATLEALSDAENGKGGSSSRRVRAQTELPRLYPSVPIHPGVPNDSSSDGS